MKNRSFTARIYSILLILVLSLGTCLGSALTVDAASPSKYTWKEKTAPNYVVTVGKARVSNTPEKGMIIYSELDKLGRTLCKLCAN